MAWLSDPAALVGLLTLTLLEIVLGIDNIIFISIVAGKLPEAEREKARIVGLSLALIMRILLLLSIGWLVGLTAPLFTLPFMNEQHAATLSGEALKHYKDQFEISGRDLILGLGGLFLIYKSVKEIHHKVEGHEEKSEAKAKATFATVIGQILILDIIFSLDSVITAVGMVKDVGVMITAVIISVGFMLVYSGHISKFVDRHPSIKMLALAFLVLIGTNLVAEAGAIHIEKAYTYFAMAFAVIVEMLNIRVQKGKAQSSHA